MERKNIMSVTKPVKFPKVAAYMRKVYQQWWKVRFNETGTEPNQREFADYLEVNASSLNQWMQGVRQPNMAQMILLSNKLGPGIFYAEGVDAPMPDIPELRDLAENWPFLTDEQKQKLYSLYEDFIKLNEAADDGEGIGTVNP